MLTYAEITDFMISRSPHDKTGIIRTIDESMHVYTKEFGFLTGLLLYSKDMKHIYFFGADTPYARKDLVKQALKVGIKPATAHRRGKLKQYKNPERLLQKLLTF